MSLRITIGITTSQITGTGTINTFAIFTGANVIGNSILSQTASSLVLANARTIVSATAGSMIDLGSGTSINITTDAGVGSAGYLQLTPTVAYLQGGATGGGTLTLNDSSINAACTSGSFIATTAGLGVTTRGIGMNASLLQIYHATSITLGSRQVSFPQVVQTSGSPTAVLVTGAAHTTLTFGEAIDVNLALNRTIQFAGNIGVFTNQRAVLVQAPTYAFTSASTITNAATFAISGAPVAGVNATLTNTYSLWVQAGRSQFDGTINGITFTNATTATVTMGTSAVLTINKSFTVNSILTLAGVDNKTLTINNSLSFAGVDGKVLTVSDSTTLATNSITFAGTEILTLTATKNVTFGDAFITSGAFSTTLTATGITNVTLPTTGTLATLAGVETFTNKTYNTGGVGNVFQIAGTGITAVSGTGAVVLVSNAVLIAPTLGAALATNINGLAISTTIGGILTIANGQTLTVNQSFSFFGSGSSTVGFGSGGTVAYVANNLSVFGATTSAQLAGVISNETGSGALVFAISPTLSKVVYSAGVALAGGAPLKLTPGDNLTTTEQGAWEFDGVNLFFTRLAPTGSRENVLVAVDNVAAPTTTVGVAIVNFFGSSATNFLGTPNRWLSVNITGVVYKMPLYT